MAYVRQVYGPLREELDSRERNRAAQGLPFHEMPIVARASDVPPPVSEWELELAANNEGAMSQAAPVTGPNPLVNRVRGEMDVILTGHRRHAAEVIKYKRQLEEEGSPIFAEADVRTDMGVNPALYAAMSNLSQIEALTEDDMGFQDDDDEAGIERRASFDEAYDDLDECVPGGKDTRPTSLIARLHLEAIMGDIPDSVADKIEDLENFFTLLYVGLIEDGLALEDGEEFMRRMGLLKNSALLDVIDLMLGCSHVPSPAIKGILPELSALREDLLALLEGYTWKHYTVEFGGVVAGVVAASKRKAKSAREKHLAELRTALVGDKVLVQLKKKLVNLREKSERDLAATVKKYEADIQKSTSEFTAQLKVSNDAVTSLTSRLDDALKDRADAVQECQNMRNSFEKSNQSLAELRENAAVQAMNHEKEVNELNFEHSTTLARLEDVIASTKQTVDTLTAYKAFAVDRISSLEGSLADSVQHVIRLSQEIEKHLESIASLQHTRKVLEEEVQASKDANIALIEQNRMEQDGIRQQYEAVLATERALMEAQRKVMLERDAEIAALKEEVKDLQQCRKDLQSLRGIHAKALNEITALKQLGERLRSGWDDQRRSHRLALVNNFLLRIAAIRKPDIVRDITHQLEVARDQQKWVEDTLGVSTGRLVESRALAVKRTAQRDILRSQVYCMEVAAMNFHELLSKSRYANKIVTRSHGTQYHERSFVGLFHEMDPPYSEQEGEPTPRHHPSHPIREMRHRPMSAPLEQPSLGELPSGLSVEGTGGPAHSVIDASPYDYFGKLRQKKITESKACRKGHVAVSGTGTVCSRLPPTYSNPAGAWRKKSAHL